MASGPPVEQANLILFVEQAPDQRLERERWIGEFIGAHGAGERRDAFPFGMVELGVEPLAAVLALRQMLDEQPAGDAAAARLAHAQPDHRRDLFGLDEIALRRLGQAVAVERNDALIAFVAARLIEGDRQIAGAEQREQAGIGARLGQLVLVELDIAPQLRRRDNRRPAG